MKKAKHFIKEYGFIILCACIISSTFIFSSKICVVSGRSMVPTLENAELLVMKTNADKFERYEIVVFNNDKTTGNYIKRVIGLPGEAIYMENNVIYINGKPIEDAVNIDIKNYGYLKDGITLKQDEYFVMGDNRNDSYDSREIGPVKTSDIKGKVVFSLSHMEKINTELKGDISF